MFTDAHRFSFVIGIAFFVMMMTNFIMNVVAIAIWELDPRLSR
jgi:sodium-dependent dicarboxylate transporter 2/3/5